jgi:hypothetical protein
MNIYELWIKIRFWILDFRIFKTELNYTNFAYYHINDKNRISKRQH